MRETKRLVVLISGSGSNLQAIIDAYARPSKEANDTPQEAIVSCVISNRPDAFGLTRASEAGIETACIDHTQFINRDEFDRALKETIDQHNPHLVILAGFMRILTAEFVKHYRGRLVNIHPSLLPKYTGLNTHQRAIDEGDDEAGVTVHFVTEELDGGPPIAQAKVPIEANDTAETLAARVLKEEHLIYPRVIDWFVNDRLTLVNDTVLLDNKEIHLDADN